MQPAVCALIPLRAGVSQRDCTSYYGFLEEETDRLCATLEEFFAAEICKKFPDPDCEKNWVRVRVTVVKRLRRIGRVGIYSPFSI